MLKLSIILITISAIAKAFCDSIQFHTSSFPFQNDWWLGKGEYLWSNRTWLEANIFSFISDGWHLFDAIRVVPLLVIISLLLVEVIFKKLDLEPEPLTADRPNYNKTFAIIAITILAYVYHGLVFELVVWIL